VPSIELYKFEDVVKPGMPIILDVSSPESLEGEYKSQVYDYSVSDKRMRIAMPSFKGRLVPLPKNSRAYVKIIDKGALYVFQGVILWSGKWPEDNLPSTIISIPEMVRRVQRRRFIRIPLRVVGKYRREGFNDYKTFSSLDFSAGGMLIVVGEQLQVDEKIYITVKLKPDLELVDHPSKVRREAGTRNIDGKLLRLYGIEFLDLNLSLEKKLVRFVMEKEVEYRKKGILI
jgi:c-di-GMP-binding flagellar brake protein YcgR